MRLFIHNSSLPDSMLTTTSEIFMSVFQEDINLKGSKGKGDRSLAPDTDNPFGGKACQFWQPLLFFLFIFVTKFFHENTVQFFKVLCLQKAVEKLKLKHYRLNIMRPCVKNLQVKCLRF